MFLFRSSFVSVAFVFVLSVITQCALVSAAPGYAFNHAFNVDAPVPSDDSSVSASPAVEPSPAASVVPLEEPSPLPQADSVSPISEPTPAADLGSVKQTSGSPLTATTSMGVTIFIGTVAALVQVL